MSSVCSELETLSTVAEMDALSSAIALAKTAGHSMNTQKTHIRHLSGQCKALEASVSQLTARLQLSEARSSERSAQLKETHKRLLESQRMNAEWHKVAAALREAVTRQKGVRFTVANELTQSRAQLKAANEALAKTRRRAENEKRDKESMKRSAEKSHLKWMESKQKYSELFAVSSKTEGECDKLRAEVAAERSRVQRLEAEVKEAVRSQRTAEQSKDATVAALSTQLLERTNALNSATDETQTEALKLAVAKTQLAELRQEMAEMKAKKSRRKRVFSENSDSESGGSQTLAERIAVKRQSGAWNAPRKERLADLRPPPTRRCTPPYPSDASSITEPKAVARRSSPKRKRDKDQKPKKKKPKRRRITVKTESESPKQRRRKLASKSRRGFESMDTASPTPSFR